MRAPLMAAAVLLLGACSAKRAVWGDPSLPNPVEAIEVLPPITVLEQGSASDDPSVRARALGLLIRLSPSVDDGGWAKRALWDPDGWVQRQGVLALGSRLDDPQAVTALETYVRRTDTLVDAYARGAAGTRLSSAGHKGTKDALHAAWTQAKTPWAAAPLQLAAAAMGDTEAVAPLGKALGNADVPMEPLFLQDVGASGLDLGEALAKGDAWVEDDMRLAFAAARVQLGDKGGMALLRSALEGDDELAALEALDYVSALQGEEGTKLLKRARSGGSELARNYAAMALVPRGLGGTAVLEDGILHEDREVRELAVRFSAELAQQPDAERKAVKSARKVLKQGVLDLDLAVRLSALRGVADLGITLQGAEVEKHLADELLAVRVEAAGALLSAER